MISSKILFFFCLLFCFSFGQVLQAKKTVDREGSSYKVTIAFRASGGAISKVDLVDNLPSTVELVSGELVGTAKSVGAEWKHHSYTIALNIPKTDFSLENKTLDIELPPATLSFVGSSQQKEEVTTESITLSADMKDFVIVQGGWLVRDHLVATIVTALFTLVFPVIAAINIINTTHGQALGKKKAKSKKAE